ncbi:hypothetical protein ACFCX0_40620 [Streptomyces sp. NPDC056352]|uniref:hypothetical protein n=1 Tax=Streptomyces sp. NPDC056352 TaxID=3345791 RepID=UPI0035E2483E
MEQERRGVALRAQGHDRADDGRPAQDRPWLLLSPLTYDLGETGYRIAADRTAVNVTRPNYRPGKRNTTPPTARSAPASSTPSHA